MFHLKPLDHNRPKLTEIKRSKTTDKGDTWLQPACRPGCPVFLFCLGFGFMPPFTLGSLKEIQQRNAISHIQNDDCLKPWKPPYMDLSLGF